MNTSRETIFKSIRDALSPIKERAARPSVPRGVADAKWLPDEADSIALFKKQATASGTICFTDLESLAKWLESEKTRLLYIPSEFKPLVDFFSSRMNGTTEYTRAKVDEIDACITPAAAGIAESGTIVITDESTPDRLAALAPWYHIALLDRADIHRTIGDALAAMPKDPNIIWVTGPSKTADVEGILIQGVHGPGAQACLIV
jgi:L-lactate dehydrogenase complex protein LldG